jgi:hypothetical protein
VRHPAQVQLEPQLPRVSGGIFPNVYRHVDLQFPGDASHSHPFEKLKRGSWLEKLYEWSRRRGSFQVSMSLEMWSRLTINLGALEAVVFSHTS